MVPLFSESDNDIDVSRSRTPSVLSSPSVSSLSFAVEECDRREGTEESANKAQFSSRVFYFLTLLGSSVGTGNVWR